MKKDFTRRTFSLGVSILPRHKEQIDHLIEDKGTFKSVSEVIQRAIEFFHEKTYPDYVFHMSPAAQLKAKKLKEIKEKEAVTHEELADQLKAVPVTGPDGINYYRIRGNSNVDRCIPVDKFKDVVANDDFLITPHKNFIAAGGVIPAEFTKEVWPRV